VTRIYPRDVRNLVVEALGDTRVVLVAGARQVGSAGVVLDTGAQTIPLGDRLWAVPLSGLWA
jgi:hypothetical protein